MFKKENEAKIIVSKDGPYLVSGNLPLKKEISITNKEGIPVKWKKGKEYQEKESYSLCRCGKSKNNPFCDGSHINCKFNGKETASTKNYLEEADKIEGPEMILTDNINLCAIARFCEGGIGTWDLVTKSDKKSKKMFIQQCANCPSGRLVAWNKKTGKAIEPNFKKEISLIEDPSAGVSGPIWAKGEIEVQSSSGKKYEKRNRVTLCRCGQSKNKPFCDGSHIDCRFNDGDKSLS